MASTRPADVPVPAAGRGPGCITCESRALCDSACGLVRVVVFGSEAGGVRSGRCRLPAPWPPVLRLLEPVGVFTFDVLFFVLMFDTV